MVLHIYFNAHHISHGMQMETITGIKYPEQNLLLDSIFWGVLGGLTVLFMLACIVSNCIHSHGLEN
jgi:hypothetical protein